MSDIEKVEIDREKRWGLVPLAILLGTAWLWFGWYMGIWFNVVFVGLGGAFPETVTFVFGERADTLSALPYSVWQLAVHYWSLGYGGNLIGSGLVWFAVGLAVLVAALIFGFAWLGRRFFGKLVLGFGSVFLGISLVIGSVVLGFFGFLGRLFTKPGSKTGIGFNKDVVRGTFRWRKLTGWDLVREAAAQKSGDFLKFDRELWQKNVAAAEAELERAKAREKAARGANIFADQMVRDIAASPEMKKPENARAIQSLREAANRYRNMPDGIAERRGFIRVYDDLAASSSKDIKRLLRRGTPFRVEMDALFEQAQAQERVAMGIVARSPVIDLQGPVVGSGVPKVMPGDVNKVAASIPPAVDGSTASVSQAIVVPAVASAPVAGSVPVVSEMPVAPTPLADSAPLEPAVRKDNVVVLSGETGELKGTVFQADLDNLVGGMVDEGVLVVEPEPDEPLTESDFKGSQEALGLVEASPGERFPDFVWRDEEKDLFDRNSLPTTTAGWFRWFPVVLSSLNSEDEGYGQNNVLRIKSSHAKIHLVVRIDLRSEDEQRIGSVGSIKKLHDFFAVVPSLTSQCAAFRDVGRLLMEYEKNLVLVYEYLFWLVNDFRFKPNRGIHRFAEIPSLMGQYVENPIEEFNKIREAIFIAWKPVSANSMFREVVYSDQDMNNRFGFWDDLISKWAPVPTIPAGDGMDSLERGAEKIAKPTDDDGTGDGDSGTGSGGGGGGGLADVIVEEYPDKASDEEKKRKSGERGLTAVDPITGAKPVIAPGKISSVLGDFNEL